MEPTENKGLRLRNHSYENVKPMKPVNSGIRINLKSRGEGGSPPRSESIPGQAGAQPGDD
ncbi:MAG: hypothetical protein QXE79_02165 [Candidatus Bathyarchaeia archaeon]